MDNRIRGKSDNHGRSQNRRPPRVRGKWQEAIVPSWEKQFCKVVGSLNWNKLLQMQKFAHLYGNVLKWDDSAGEEAFYNAKKRFFAEINGRSCEISLPDPDLYIDKINWDSKIDPELELDLESKYAVSNTNTEEDRDHEPVVIFGNSLIPYQEYSASGWGDIEDDNTQQVQTDYNAIENVAGVGWPDYYSNNANWQHADDMMWEDNGWNDWGQDYTNNNFHNYEVGPGIEKNMHNGEDGWWNDGNITSYGNPKFKQMPVVGSIYR